MGKRTRKWLALLLVLALAVAVDYGVSTVLRLKPLWIYQPEKEDKAQEINLSIECFSNDGRWMLVHGADVPGHREIVDRQTGRAVPGIDLSNVSDIYNHGYLHALEPFFFSQNSLWWLTSRQQGGEIELELRCLPFLAGRQETVVHRWRFSSIQRGHIRWIDTDAFHVVFQLETQFEPALQSLASFTQDLPGYLTPFQSAWNSCQCFEVWRIAQDRDERRCEKQTYYFKGDMNSFSDPTATDQQGVEYAIWSRVEAYRVLTGETLGDFPLPSRDHLSGKVALPGDLLYYRRYFHYFDPRSGNTAEFSPRNFVQHPKATFDDYALVFDRSSRKPLRWPTGMPREYLIDDRLHVATQCPWKVMLSSSSNGISGLRGNKNLCLMTRQGDELVLDRELLIDNVVETVYSSDATQVYADRRLFREELYPMLFTWVRSAPVLQHFIDLLPAYRGGTEVLDAETGEVLCTIPNAYLRFDDFTREQLYDRGKSNGQLILARSSTPGMFPPKVTGFECWPMPVSVYSPWWAHGAAMLVVILYYRWYRWGKRNAAAGVIDPFRISS